MVKTLTWKDIVEADMETLKKCCEDHDLSIRGDEENLRERLLRHVLKITLPSGELFLKGKMNINTATRDEMRLWPFMGDTLINGILAYRKRYGKFYKLEDLMNVKGVGPSLFEKIIQYVDISGKTHIKVLKTLRVDADMELIKLEDDIRNKTWEMQDLKDRLDIEMDTIAGRIKQVDTKEKTLAERHLEIEKVHRSLKEKEDEFGKRIKELNSEVDILKGIEEKKLAELEILRSEKIITDEKLPWNFIIKAPIADLQKYCEERGLSPRGDAASLRDRLMRNVLNIELPLGNVFLEGKLNINTASYEVMILWPYMGDTLVNNIIKYRNKYGKFSKIEDLMNVKGVGPNLYKKLIPFIDVTGNNQVRVKSKIRADANMELLKLEDDIRNKTWELQDLKDHFDIDMELLSGLISGMQEDKDKFSEEIEAINSKEEKLDEQSKEIEEIRERFEEKFQDLRDMRIKKEEDLEEVKALKEEAEARMAAAEMRIMETEEERLSLEGEKASIQTEKDLIESQREELDEMKQELEEKQSLADAKNKDIENRESEIEKLENEIEADDRRLKAEEEDLEERNSELAEKEKTLNELAYGIGMSSHEEALNTVDIPVIIQLDPADENKEDDNVILASTDGYIKRILNIHKEGTEIETDVMKVTFTKVPVEKTYNVVVDTGELTYYVLKNFNPGGDE